MDPTVSQKPSSGRICTGPRSGFPACTLVRLIAVIGLTVCISAAEANSRPVPYSTVQVVAPGDSPELAAEKAAMVLPRPNQSAWMRLERTFFLHFGVNTFRGVEWGTGRESPDIFNPSALDAGQWVDAVKNAGGEMMILVCKHHDGFCMWPTRYTPHSVVASPWLGGKGDLVRAVADAARRRGVKLGIYLSPADLYQLRTNPLHPGGYYGDGSASVPSVIPTDPAHFRSNPTIGRQPPADFGRYTYVVDDYNRYFLNQLYELLTQYGPISDVWFDGANPDPSVHETYDYSAWYDLIRHLQPGAVISVKGPDVRWVGNEGGYGRTTEWSVIPLSEPPEKCTWPDRQDVDLGSRAKLKPGSYLWWYPAEVNTPILNGWFWSPQKRAKSPSELIDYYYRSVGRNGNMLLNLSPDTRGLIPDDQLASLATMAQVVDRTFARNLAEGAEFTADSSDKDHPADQAHDGNLDTWWEAAPGHRTATFTINLPSTVSFDVVSLQEAVDHRGQRIESFVIETWNGGAWTAPASLEEQTTVGHKRLVRLKNPVATNRVRIRITGSRLEPTLAEVGLYKQAILAPAPVLADRDATGKVAIDASQGTVVYTTDGKMPTLHSAVYRSPIPMDRGGVLRAAQVTSDGRMGLVSSRTYVGMTPLGWTVVDGGEGANASKAVDGNALTTWYVDRHEVTGGPAHITVDLGRVHQVRGFTYLPRQDGKSAGVVDDYRFETSEDGVHWVTDVASGRFGNIKNNPVLQEVSFPPVTARYFRFTALKDVDGNASAGAAEISLIPVAGE